VADRGLPDDWTPFADEPARVPDRQLDIADAFRPPAAMPVKGLPEDWDLDLSLSPATRPQAAPAPQTPALALPEDWDPFAEEAENKPPPATIPQPLRDDAAADPFAEPGLPSRTIPSAAPPSTAVEAAAPVVPSPAAGTAPDAALAALLRGAGLSPTAIQGSDPLEVIERAGATLRAAIAGLRALLIARADVKREFRIEQTMLRAAGNNPVKFAATDEAALAALLAGGPGPRALAETVDDLTAHQVASLAATQAAARALLTRLAPEGLEAGEASGGLFGGREKRLWEAYRRLHVQVTEQFEDDFDSAFGKEFARAYEQATRR
jgi:type VI secretion system protein ImpI/type VI secretion system protein